MEKLIILGAGESGISTALLAQKVGDTAFLSDRGALSSSTRDTLLQHGISYEEGGHSPALLEGATCVVKSPGIPDTAPVVQQAIALGLPVISEIEYAYRHKGDSRIIAISGSNGKTTTTSLIAHLLQSAGLDAVACGNIGTSLARHVAVDPHAIYVVELSSFQLDHMYDFTADIALLTNITPDHLDRYSYSLDLYADAKGRLFRNQTPAQLAILFADDPITAAMLTRLDPPLGATVQRFSTADPSTDAYTTATHMVIRTADAPLLIPYAHLPLQGRHNLYNMMAASLAALHIGLSHEQIITGLQSFVAVEHRMEPVATIKGVRYINDSKATNIDSTHYALEAMPDSRTLLLLGGTDKGNDYSLIHSLVEQKAKALIFLTTDRDKLHAAFDGLELPTFDAESMEEAFTHIEHLSPAEGDVVLLSPACASFDLFKNYEHRGLCFKACVQALITKG